MPDGTVIDLVADDEGANLSKAPARGTYDQDSTDDVAQTYVWIAEQPKSAWSNEIELRPFTEDWTF